MLILSSPHCKGINNSVNFCNLVSVCLECKYIFQKMFSALNIPGVWQQNMLEDVFSIKYSFIISSLEKCFTAVGGKWFTRHIHWSEFPTTHHSYPRLDIKHRIYNKSPVVAAAATPPLTAFLLCLWQTQTPNTNRLPLFFIFSCILLSLLHHRINVSTKLQIIQIYSKSLPWEVFWGTRNLE